MHFVIVLHNTFSARGRFAFQNFIVKQAAHYCLNIFPRILRFIVPVPFPVAFVYEGGARGATRVCTYGRSMLYFLLVRRMYAPPSPASIDPPTSITDNVPKARHNCALPCFCYQFLASGFLGNFLGKFSLAPPSIGMQY